MAHPLFSYGTLQLPEVQRSNFGRLLPNTPDRLPGFELAVLRITDPEVVASSGTDLHPILRYTGDNSAFVEGSVLELSDEELAAADGYEVGEYTRVLVTLASGTEAWVYADSRNPAAGLPSPLA